MGMWVIMRQLSLRGVNGALVRLVAHFLLRLVGVRLDERSFAQGFCQPTMISMLASKQIYLKQLSFERT